MKKTFRFLVIIFCSIALWSCDDYDDSFLKSEIDKIKADIESLKKQVTTVESVVEAINTGKVITKVEKLEENKGYTITFNDATTIELLNGESAPVIGVKESEGTYYWTITTDGKTGFLKDGKGEKLPVSGQDGKTPSVAIDAEGYWTIDKVRIKDEKGNFIQAIGDSFFQEVVNSEEAVELILADGTSIVLPKSQGTYLLFESESSTPSFVFRPGQRQRLKIKFSSDIKSMEIVSLPKGWTANIHRPDKYVEVIAPTTASYGFGEVKLQGIDQKGLTFLAIAKISIAGKGYSDPDGIFILNEGNMTTENGSLIYIAPDGELYDRIYYSSNGTELGNVTQDLFIANDKLYIISQNGRKNPNGTVFENDGMLIVTNSETMKKEATYNDELSTLSWPTHLAVLDDQNIYIRDNNGVHLFNSTSKELKLIEGTKGANKNRMAVIGNRVFVPAGKKILVLEKGKEGVVKTIEMDGAITGVIKSKDGNIWTSTTGKPNRISKIDSKTFSIIKSNDITDGKLNSASTPGITAKGDTLYYSGGKTTIYRHIFSKGETKLMVDAKTMVENAGIVYNSIGVHPRTGKVYLNTLKSFGWDFLINNISVFDFDGPQPVLVNNYKDYTHFPAGIFFPADFK